MPLKRKQLSFATVLLLSSVFLASCGEKEKDSSEENISEEQVVKAKDYTQISQQIKVDSYLNKIEDYNFEGYFYPAGISEYDRTIMSKTLNKFSHNPYLFDTIYAMTNGDYDEKTIVKEFNTLYTHIKVFRESIAEMRNAETLAAFNKRETTLESFKSQSLAQQEAIHLAYDTIKNLTFDSIEGQQLQKFHLYYLDFWMLEIDNQFETIERLTEKQQKTYNVTDFSLRLSNYGEEGSFVDTFIILLEAKHIKEAGLEKLEEEKNEEAKPEAKH